MNVIQTTTITLEDEEISALKTLKRTYDDCVGNDCYECEVCPLYFGEKCIGVCADMILSKQEIK